MDDDDFCFLQRIPGGSRAKRNANAAECWWDDERDIVPKAGTPVNLRKRREAQQYSFERKKEMYATDVRTILAPLPFDLQHYILQLAHINPDMVLPVSLKVIFSSQ